MLRGLIFVFAGMFLIVGCNDSQQPDPLSTGKRYVPFETGQFWVYQVSELEGSDTVDSMLRLQVIDSDNSSGDSTYILGEFEQENGAWKQMRSIGVRLNETQMFLNDQNDVSLELVFPMENGKSWFRYPNADQELNEFPLEMNDIGRPFEQWTNTVTVTSVSQLGPQITNIYAEDTGLVFALVEPEYEEWKLIETGIE